MRVLNLVTNDEARFYQQQVCALHSCGVRERTLAVPGTHSSTSDNNRSRSVVDYLWFYPLVLRASLNRYDLVHANYGLTAPAALLQPRRPVVLSLWGSDLLGTYGPLSRVCARAADAVIVMSDEMADVLGHDCHVIPHGVDLSLFFPAEQAAARRRVGWPVDGLQVLFPYPPQRTVKDYPRARRVVDAAAASLGEPIELRTLSGVPHDQMVHYMNAADALLLTSKSEGSPNSVKEALACDLPVVSTDVGDVSTLLSGVERSFVCRSDRELVDGLVAILESGERSNGRLRAADFGLEAMAEQIIAVYQSVLERDTQERRVARHYTGGDETRLGVE